MGGLAADSNGRVYIGSGHGGDHGASVATDLFKYWSGTAWMTVGSGMYGSATERFGLGNVTALVADGTDIYAAGDFDAGVSGSTIIYSTNIIKWDGTSWHAMGTPIGNGIAIGPNTTATFRKIVVSNTNVFVTGDFNNDNGSGPVSPIGLDQFSINCSHVQAHSLLQASGDLGSGHDVSARNGIVYVAGVFDSVDSITVTGLARWNGGSWSIVGQSSGVNGACRVAAADPFGVLFVDGDFDHADGAAIPNGTPISWVGP